MSIVLEKNKAYTDAFYQ